MVWPEREQLTGAKSPRFYCTERTKYTPPPMGTKLLRPAARMDIHFFESRKWLSTGEQAVEVNPAIGIKRLNSGVVIYDGDIVHARKWREVFERCFPKPDVGLVGLRPDGQ